MQTILSLLREEQKKLLDTTLSSPLLNYRLRVAGLELNFEYPDDIFYRLVDRQESIAFKATNSQEFEDNFPEIDFDGIEDDYLESDNERSDSNFWSRISRKQKNLLSNGTLETNYNSTELTKRLNSIYRKSQSVQKEFGFNPFYLTLGMLRWTPQKSEKAYFAPLILIPVDLEKLSKVSPYQLYYSDNEVEPNLTLREKLYEELGEDIISTNLDNLSISEYFSQMEERIRELELSWSVDKNLVTIREFNFKKYYMFKDLNENSWPSSPPQNHPLIKMLLRDGFSNSEVKDYHRAHNIDQAFASYELFQIYNADSSQLIAIRDVSEGSNLIIQGPPGTGKSQTITNIIAQAIGEHKKVLFVAQKKTALDVVQRKLEKAGLGKTCLQLYGDHAKRSVFLRQLQEVIDENQIPDEFLDGSYVGDNSLNQLTELLNNYSFSLNNPYKDSGVTLYQCFEMLLTLREQLKNTTYPPLFDLNIFASFSKSNYENSLRLIENYQSLIGELGEQTNNP